MELLRQLTRPMRPAGAAIVSYALRVSRRARPCPAVKGGRDHPYPHPPAIFLRLLIAAGAPRKPVRLVHLPNSPEWHALIETEFCDVASWRPLQSQSLEAIIPCSRDRWQRRFGLERAHHRQMAIQSGWRAHECPTDVTWPRPWPWQLMQMGIA